jgi:hypothetical protein
MHLIEHYELRTPRVVAFQLKAQSEIRVVSGRLWLTLEGLPEDVWLQPGEAWTLPVNGQLWLSAEPVAAFRVAQFSGQAQPLQPLLAFFKTAKGALKLRSRHPACQVLSV